ncbi:MAG: carbohydrate ABC transporter substrate-binding protein [Erysipelotrichaceae bacterium]|nr:carbohydrate ABC transporter substrate-binding protein [Erysipelotrichaceae bacterium]MDY5251606.1 carbohydrate ABC transporter substrate-binding protein [Erysipelotrichaceae bacterium]
MKKIVKLVLSLILVGSVITGCTPASDDSTAGTDGAGDGTEKRVLKVDIFSGGNGEKVFKDLETAFEAANPDVDVQLRVEKELDQVLNKDNAKGVYSDVVYYNLGQPSGYTESQLNTNEVLEISDVIAEIDIDPSFANNSVVQYYGDGKSYLLPLKTTPAGFFYNTELVGEGKTYELPTTWDEFFALGDKLKAEGGPALFTYPVKGYFDNTINAMIAQAGGDDFLKDVLQYKDGVWETEEGKSVLDLLAKLVDPNNGYLYADTVANANSGQFTVNQQAVIDGKALFMPNGDWVVNEMADTTPTEGFHWGLAPVPALTEGGDSYVGSMTEQVWIPKQAQNVEDAKKFLKFIYSEEGSAIMLEYGNVVPVKGFNEKIKNMEDGYTKEFFSVYDVAKGAIGAFAPYDTTNLPDFNLKSVVFGPIDEIATGKSTAEDWQASLNENWDLLAQNPMNK